MPWEEAWIATRALSKSFTQALAACTLPPRLCTSTSRCGLHCRRHRHRLGSRLQLHVHILVRPDLTTMDYQASWTLHGPNTAAQVPDFVKHGYRHHDFRSANQTRMAIANAED